MYRLQLCALPLVLALLPGTALAQTPDHANDEAPLELPADAPLDLSTPELEPGKLTPTTPFAEKPPASDWAGKVGIDYSKPAIPAVMFQPEQLLAGAVPESIVHWPYWTHWIFWLIWRPSFVLSMSEPLGSPRNRSRRSTYYGVRR